MDLSLILDLPVRCLVRTEADREFTSEPWSTMQRVNKEQRRPLFGVNGEVRSRRIWQGRHC